MTDTVPTQPEAPPEVQPTQPPAPPKRSGVWKWVAIGCAILLLLALLIGGVLGFFAYKGYKAAKQRIQEQASSLGGRGGPLGLPPASTEESPATPPLEGTEGYPGGSFTAEKVERFFEAYPDWPKIRGAMERDDFTALSAIAAVRGFENALEMTAYYGIAMSAAGSMAHPDPEFGRRIIEKTYGPKIAEIVYRPENREKLKWFLGPEAH